MYLYTVKSLYAITECLLDPKTPDLEFLEMLEIIGWSGGRLFFFTLVSRVFFIFPEKSRNSKIGLG